MEMSNGVKSEDELTTKSKLPHRRRQKPRMIDFAQAACGDTPSDADVNDSDSEEDVPRVRVMKRRAVAGCEIATQTSWKDRLPASTMNDADAVIRTVQIRQLWTRNERKQAQQNDEEIVPVLAAKMEGRNKPHGDDLHGITAPARL